MGVLLGAIPSAELQSPWSFSIRAIRSPSSPLKNSLDGHGRLLAGVVLNQEDV